MRAVRETIGRARRRIIKSIGLSDSALQALGKDGANLTCNVNPEERCHTVFAQIPSESEDNGRHQRGLCSQVQLPS